MPLLLRTSRHVLGLSTRKYIERSIGVARGIRIASASQPQRWIHEQRRLLSEEGLTSLPEGIPEFLDNFKLAYDAPTPTLRLEDSIVHSKVGDSVTAVGFLQKITEISKDMTFAQLGFQNDQPIQLLCRNNSALNHELRNVRVGSAISVTGLLGRKYMSKRTNNEAKDTTSTEPSGDTLELTLGQAEIHLQQIRCINAFPADVYLNKKGAEEFSYPPQQRHLQIRFDKDLRRDLNVRSLAARFIRNHLEDFQEIETPILFKSTPEGAREFFVPTRKKGYSYALPQSPQQYKQILMASGFNRYFQFAKCFRDEDLRADRQPEFTQIDLEMAWASGEDVMKRVEALVQALYIHLATFDLGYQPALTTTPFPRITYWEAMDRHGSDKPDLRIQGPIHRVDQFLPESLKRMLTDIKNPIVEVCKFELDGAPSAIKSFIFQFMESPEAEAFRTNADGAPGSCIYDSRAPLEGLQIFGHEGAEALKKLYRAEGSELTDGNLLIIQAREDKPHSGGSTVLGKLRLAVQKAALAQDLIEPDLNHHYLWVTDFPMFTPDNSNDPGQGGAAGFSATHHPFTAPKTKADVDLLLTDPTKAIADHYDLVVNGVELGGGSRRIHNAEMQKFIMHDIIKMSEERMADFSHLFDALRAGCPPHAGLAIGFDRLIAVLRGRESVKDVIAFPKSSKGEDLMVRSPSRVSEQELKRYHLRLDKSGMVGEGEAVRNENDEKLVEETPSKA